MTQQRTTFTSSSMRKMFSVDMVDCSEEEEGKKEEEEVEEKEEELVVVVTFPSSSFFDPGSSMAMQPLPSAFNLDLLKSQPQR